MPSLLLGSNSCSFTPKLKSNCLFLASNVFILSLALFLMLSSSAFCFTLASSASISFSISASIATASRLNSASRLSPSSLANLATSFCWACSSILFLSLFSFTIRSSCWSIFLSSSFRRIASFVSAAKLPSLSSAWRPCLCCVSITNGEVFAQR